MTCALIASVAAPVQAAYPEKPITIIVAWDAGGAIDLVTRSLQPVLSKQLGADLVVKNVSGAAGTIGTAEAARAKPDGYTILITPTGPLTTQPHMRKLPYDFDSFAAIGRIAVSEMLMMATKTSKYKTLKDVVDGAKADPGQVKIASTGAGTLPHISILALDKEAGIKSKHIPYKGSANVMKALLGGEVDLFSDQALLVPKYDLHPIVAWSEKRLPDFPNVPTVKESGYDISMANWAGLFAPKGTPQAVIDKLATALKNTLADPSIIKAMDNLKTDIGYMPPKEFATFADITDREITTSTFCAVDDIGRIEEGAAGGSHFLEHAGFQIYHDGTGNVGYSGLLT